MVNPNGQEHLNETELDVFGGEPLTGSGFEDESAEFDFGEGAEE